MSVSIGILGMQGDIQENRLALERAADEMRYNFTIVRVMAPKDVSKLDGLVIPGGESTTIGSMARTNETADAIRQKVADGMPVLGICAGMILLANQASDRTVGRTGQPLLDCLDIQLERNSFGRQRQSFEAEISMEGIGIPKYRGVFIRAPAIVSAPGQAETIATIDGKVVAIKKGNIMGVAFHPELTHDSAVHRHFIDMVKSRA